jgi:hypothetical protein
MSNSVLIVDDAKEQDTPDLSADKPSSFWIKFKAFIIHHWFLEGIAISVFALSRAFD